MKLAGQRVVITGASSGIGRAAALRFAAAGCRLALASRRMPELEAVAAECRARGVEAFPIRTDVSSSAECDSLIEQATSLLGGIDILVNNAGFAIFDPIADASRADLERMMQTNYFGAVYCTQAVLPQMIARGRGAIVNVASIAGIMGFAGMGGYCATKFAMIGFSEALRDEVLSRGVTVSAVCPGTTRTDFFRIAEKGKMPAASRLMLAITPERVARAVVRAAVSGTPRIVVPATAGAFMKFKEISPRPAHLLMRRVSDALKGKSKT